MKRDEKTIHLIDHILYADTFWKRLKGLLGTSHLPKDTGLLLRPCSQIRTWGMKYPIDVLYLDEIGRIVEIDRQVPPNRWKRKVPNAKMVLEISAGQIKGSRKMIGLKVDFLEEKREQNEKKG